MSTVAAPVRVRRCLRHHTVLASCDDCIAWLLRDLRRVTP